MTPVALRTCYAAVVGTAFALGTGPAMADRDRDFRATLKSVNEVPSIISGASGRFRLELDERNSMISWELSYSGLESTVTQAHIHVGQHHTNGGIAVFLCATPPTAPASGPIPQTCPATSGRISGTIVAGQVIGPLAQGVSAGEFAALVRAIKSGAAYANVHTQTFGSGEIRGQIEDD
jgi:CHRD domain